MNHLRVVFVGVLLIAAGIGPTSALADARESSVPVQTILASEREIEQTLELTGSVSALKTVTVLSKVTGEIEKLLVERGMQVKAGDPIAVVEHEAELAQRDELVAAVEMAEVGVRQAQAAVKVAEAALAQAEAQLENAALEKTRIENLYKDKSVPKQKYDAVMAQYKIAVAGRDLAAAKLTAAKAQVAQAQAALKQAKAALRRLDVRIADYTVRAPFSGVVTARYVDQGAMDNPALPIVQLMDVSTLKVNCDVAQVNAGKVKKGQKVILTTDAWPEVEFPGTVFIVNPAVTPKTRTLPVEIRTDGRPAGAPAGGDIRLKPGMFVKVSIQVGAKRCLAVPRDCLMRLPGTGVYYLFVVKDGKAEKRTVTLGIGRGNYVEVVEGVAPGEKVVVKGQVNLKTGMAVHEAK